MSGKYEQNGDVVQRPMISESNGRKCLRAVKDNILIILLLLSMACGIGIGVGLREVWSPTDTRKIFYLRFMGDLLLSMLKLLIIPLVVSSLITGLADLDTRASGRMGARAVIYYMTTTLVAVIIGIIMVLAIQPGNRGPQRDEITRSGEGKIVNPADAILDLIRACFPDNLIAACFETKQTSQVPVEPIMPMVNETMLNSTWLNGTETNSTPPIIYNPVITTKSSTNILGLVVFSIFMGIILGKMGPDAKPLRDVFRSLNIVIMKLVTLVIWYSPIGIMFLIAAKVVEMSDPVVIITQLGFYILTVLLGLFIHGFMVLPLIYFVITRKNPYLFFYRMLKAIITALGTASSSATLPITMECLEFRNHVDPRIIKFVAPVGATINMDGTALYEAVASIFIAQINNITLSVGQVITISITATAAAIGAAGVPQAGLITMVIVLTAVGLPIDDVTLILAVDWFLDRCRTSVNVLGDSYGAAIVDHLSKADLKRMDEDDLAKANKYEKENPFTEEGKHEALEMGSNTQM